MTKQPVVKIVSVESGIGAVGFRKIAAIARDVVPSAEICFVATGNLYSLTSVFSPSKDTALNEEDILAIAAFLAEADFVAFSSMTVSAGHVWKIAKSIKEICAKTFLVWGGVHPTLYPEESIGCVDAICIGEGEQPFRMLLGNFLGGVRSTDVPNMWFSEEGTIVKNDSLPLNTSDFLNAQPHSYNGTDCMIYDPSNRRFRRFSKFDYAKFNGLVFRTIWTLGCPYRCSYCANDAFIKLDVGYMRLRHPSVDYIIEEILRARKNFPHISTIAFYDDNFIALSLPLLREFTEKYRKVINLPFVVFGMHPNLITKEKVELLANAGMNRARMGIQSGSETTLKFFERATSIERIRDSSTILADAAKKFHMIPPAYDIISDNPKETPDEVAKTLQLVFSLKRPFTLNVFSLRVFPKTKLYDFVRENPLMLEYFKGSSYLDTKATINNVAFYLLAAGGIPKFAFEAMMVRLERRDGLTKEFPVLFKLARFLFLARRATSHLVKSDFSTIVGGWTYWIWKIRHLGRDED